MSDKPRWKCPDPGCDVDFSTRIGLESHIYRIHVLPGLMLTKLPHAVEGDGCWCGQVHQVDFERLESLFNMRSFAAEFSRRQGA